MGLVLNVTFIYTLWVIFGLYQQSPSTSSLGPSSQHPFKRQTLDRRRKNTTLGVLVQFSYVLSLDSFNGGD